MGENKKLVLDNGEIQIPIEAEKFLKLLIDNLPVKVFWKDVDLKYLGANRAFTELAGLSEHESLIGKTDFDCPWADRGEAYQLYDQSVMDSDEAEIEYIEKLQGDDGSDMWIKTTKIPIKNDEGDVIGILGFFWDTKLM